MHFPILHKEMRHSDVLHEDDQDHPVHEKLEVVVGARGGLGAVSFTFLKSPAANRTLTADYFYRSSILLCRFFFQVFAQVFFHIGRCLKVRIQHQFLERAILCAWGLESKTVHAVVCVVNVLIHVVV